jgi:moderate conductance mechanosensitive channel
MSRRLAFALLLAVFPSVALAQLPIPFPAPSTPATNYGFPVRRVGNLDTATITFQGVRLFTIAAPAAPDTSDVPPIVQRVETIEDNLRRVVPPSTSGNFFDPSATRFDPETFKIEIGSENGYSTLYATDGRHKDVAPLMTLTESDSAYYALPSAELAKQWQAALEAALAPAVLAAQPAYIRQQLEKLPYVLAGAIAFTILVQLLRRWVNRRRDLIEARAQELREAGEAASDEAGKLHVRDSLLITARSISGLLVLTLWALVILWTLTIFPPTQALARVLASRTVRILILWVLILIVNRILTVVFARISEAWEGNPFLPPGDRARQLLRRPTLLRAAESLKSTVLYTIAIGTTLSILTVSVASVLTLGAVLAFAVSFASQSLIKDFVNGWLILAEDQFAIGDYVTINGTTGLVENLTLRLTQVRTDDGKLVSMPNSSIVAVENATRSWSRIDFRVSVANNTDIAKATDLLKKTLDDLAGDAQWRATVLEPPQILGVEAVTHAGIVLRAWIKTAPGERGPLTRELNRRVDDAFRANSISIALPQTLLVQPQVNEAS